jgi:hypothetical protein
MRRTGSGRGKEREVEEEERKSVIVGGTSDKVVETAS